MEFSAETIAKALTAIYGKEFDIDSELEAHIFEETRRIFAQAAAEGIADSVEGGADVPGDEFLKALRESVDVFSAFRTHRMQNDIAAQLTDEKGQLKPFSRFAKDVQPYVRHKNRAWLRTEYDMSVRRAHLVVDWQQFEAEKDVLPNLELIPSTSPAPGADHRVFWGTVLPVDDPFWKEHRAGDRWNCKCELRATDKDCTARPHGTEMDNPQPGLENNPGKDGHLFSDKHPYYPDSCASCQYSGNRLMALFHDLAGGRKHCNSCRKVEKVVKETKGLDERKDITQMLANLQNLKGREYTKALEDICNQKVFRKKEGEKYIYWTGNDSDNDLKNLLNAARKAVEHGNKVYILPNPNNARTPDYIFVRNGLFKDYDLKTISGKNSVGNRLEESIGQTRRVLLNMTSDYNPRTLAKEIKHYFETNKEAAEVLIYKGKREMSITRSFAKNKNFETSFRKMWR